MSASWTIVSDKGNQRTFHQTACFSELHSWKGYANYWEINLDKFGRPKYIHFIIPAKQHRLGDDDVDNYFHVMSQVPALKRAMVEDRVGLGDAVLGVKVRCDITPPLLLSILTMLRYIEEYQGIVTNVLAVADLQEKTSLYRWKQATNAYMCAFALMFGAMRWGKGLEGFQAHEGGHTHTCGAVHVDRFLGCVVALAEDTLTVDGNTFTEAQKYYGANDFWRHKQHPIKCKGGDCSVIEYIRVHDTMPRMAVELCKRVLKEGKLKHQQLKESLTLIIKTLG
jgi:hypothetical protein